MARKSQPRHRWQIPVTIVLLATGLLLSVQFRTQQVLLNDLSMLKTEELVTIWKNLNEKRAKLEGEIVELRRQQRVLEDKSSAGMVAISEIQSNLNRLKTSTGLVPVKGPGITITITGDSPLLYLDLVDIVNELWASGAEAVAVNDHRVTAHTYFGDIEENETLYVTVDGERLLYPVVIKAIGDPNTLEKGLTFPGGIIDNMNTLYAIFPDIRQKQELLLPAVKTPPVWFYAAPKSGTAPATAQAPVTSPAGGPGFGATPGPAGPGQ